MKSDPKVMLLVDADNVSADVVEQAFAKVLEERGAIHVRRAYCTAESAAKNLQLFKRLSIRPIVNLSTGKNSTDIALAVDAIDLVVAERPDLVVIVSSDSDFAPLVIRLREKGCRVEGIGQEGKTGDDAKPVYDAFVDLRHGKARAAARPVAPKQAAKPASKRAARAPALPEDVQVILGAVPQLAAGGWVELRMAAEPLRKAGLLGKTAASTKVFKKHAAHFALQPEKAPNQVRYLGAALRG
ncbi:MAG: NYN domain-containing protein [Ideonella sp.]|nr:NYN domain-containing protein [Ideonella sp.]